MDLGRLIRQSDDFGEVVLNEELPVVPILGAFLDVGSFSSVLPQSLGQNTQQSFALSIHFLRLRRPIVDLLIQLLQVLCYIDP